MPIFLTTKHTFPPLFLGVSKPLASSAIPFGVWLLLQIVLAFNFRGNRAPTREAFVHSWTERVTLLPKEGLPGPAPLEWPLPPLDQYLASQSD